MAVDFKQFCIDYKIDYTRSGKHYRPGWANISCKFCTGHPGFHLGINLDKAYAVCHRCGYHSLYSVISVLTGAPPNAIKDIIKKYSTGESIVRRQDNRINAPSQIIFPSDTGPLTNKARQYLINRKYDPDKLASIWGIRATSHIGFYKHRILAPIYYKSQIVSFQCRDITGNHPQKYLACFQDEEIIQHQRTLYGLDQAVARGKTCVVVEGITDVWRLGPGTVAVFGIDFTKQQAQLIATNFDRVFILFDSEYQAQEKADELGYLVSAGFSNKPEVINLPFIVPDIDPGDLSQNDANALISELEI